METIPKDWITHYSHEWLNDLPLKDNMLICNRCGIRTHIHKMKEVARCTKQYATKSSGYKPEVINV